MSVKRLWPMWAALLVVGIWYAVAARAEVKPPAAAFESVRIEEFGVAPPERVFREAVIPVCHAEPACGPCEKSCGKAACEIRCEKACGKTDGAARCEIGKAASACSAPCFDSAIGFSFTCAAPPCAENADCTSGAFACATPAFAHPTAAPWLPQHQAPAPGFAAPPFAAHPPIHVWHAPAPGLPHHFLPPPPHSPLQDPMIAALVENAALKTRLEALEQRLADRQEFAEKLAKAHAETVQLKAQVEVAQKTHEFLEGLYEALVERAALRAQLDLVAEREELFETLLEVAQENAALKAAQTIPVKSTGSGRPACETCGAKTAAAPKKEGDKGAETTERH